MKRSKHNQNFARTIIFTTSDVHKIAMLANTPMTTKEEQKLADGFNTTITVVNNLFKVNVENIEQTHQVTGLENIFREDKIDEGRMLTQEQALANAPRTHDGFFVVDRILEE